MSTPALPDYEAMSDEDILNLPDEDFQITGSDPAVDEPDVDDVVAEAADEPSAEVQTTPHQTEPQQEAEAPGSVEDLPDTGSETTPADATPVAAEASSEPVNFESAYKQIMAPFKANGKEFSPSSPEEVVRLMQMGANYTKKMQSLKPNLKLMRMLDNHGLLEENKVSFLIDLANKDQGAIQKLLVDSKIDPLDLNTSETSKYRPGNHSVSDQELAFHDTLTDVMSTTEGKSTVQLINTQWDSTSKDAVYREPNILSIINEQRANGIYDRISAEIDRQKMMGNLTNVPFIQAYKQVGDALMTQGKLIPNQTSAQPKPLVQGNGARVLETRTAAPKSPVANGDAARAASPSRSAPKTPAKSFDVFSMSDEEIMAIPLPGAN